MKKIKLLILMSLCMLSILILFTGCSSYGKIEGTVIDKDYDSSFVMTQMIYTGTTIIPYNVFYPDSYKILIEKTVNNEKKRKWIKIPAHEYDKINIGDYYQGE